jgi:cytochrome c peroxidase
MRMIKSHYILVIGILLFPFSCSDVFAQDETPPNFENEPIQPIIPPQNLDPAKVELGRKLFNDTKLSKDNIMSCATCHLPDQGGATDTIQAPPGVSGKSVPINVPTFHGSGMNFTQFWDGRATSLEEQLDGPIANPDEMGSSWSEIVGKIKATDEYVKAFESIYGESPDQSNIKDAIATFEHSQVPVDSPFDLYLKGNKTAINPQAKKGYELFKNLGCAACHQGQNVGGNMFQKFGIIEDYFAKRGNIIDKDYGRYNVTKAEEDRYFFKVPSLRNVALTAPYFHDGSAATLEQAVDVMAQYQLGRTLSNEERNQLVAFLKTLTGKIPASPGSDKANE